MVNGYIVELEQDFVLFQKVLRNLVSNCYDSLEILVDVALLKTGTDSFDANLFQFSTRLCGLFHIKFELFKQRPCSKQFHISIILNIRNSPSIIFIFYEVLFKNLFKVRNDITSPTSTQSSHPLRV